MIVYAYISTTGLNLKYGILKITVNKLKIYHRKEIECLYRFWCISGAFYLQNVWYDCVPTCPPQISASLDVL